MLGTILVAEVLYYLQQYPIRLEDQQVQSVLMLPMQAQPATDLTLALAIPAAPIKRSTTVILKYHNGKYTREIKYAHTNNKHRKLRK